jgi:secondary thiamine-phosphate synthase enzyme
MVDITPLVAGAVRESGAQSGVAVVYVPHTTAGVTVCENADPDVKRDVLFALERAVPDAGFTHLEGNSDAHTRALLTGVSLSVIFENGRLCLGTWQGICFCEYDGPRSRRVLVKILQTI